MNLRSRLVSSEETYLLVVHQARSHDDSEAERVISEFLSETSAAAKLLVNERRDADTYTPALYANFGYFSGLDEIKAFLEVERQLILST